jgi:hypothetical protein
MSSHERPIQAGMSGAIYLPIPMTSVLDVVDRLGGTEKDADKILYIDSLMLPWIREQNKSQSGNQS